LIGPFRRKKNWTHFSQSKLGMKFRKESKKITPRERNKVAKKVKDHHRKMSKLAKKNPNMRKKLKKDPGIPNFWPYKKELLEEYQKAQDELKAKKEKKTKKQLGDDDIIEDDEETKVVDNKTTVSQMAKLALDSHKRAEEFQVKESLMKDVDDGKDIKQDSLSKSSKQKYYQEFKQVIEKSDVLLFVLDARDPIGCRCPDIEKTVQSQNPNIRIVFILNKIDLVPKEVLQKWLTYLRKEHATVAFKASTQQQKNHISRSGDTGPAENAPVGFLRADGCLGADSLLKLLKNYSRSEDIKRNITVGIIGYPNVGKSSIINSLKRVRAAKVGSTPGVTKQSQEFQLDKHIKLLDSPGIIFSSGQLDSDVILRNAIRVEKLKDPVEPVVSIVNRCRKEQLTSRYGVKDFKDATHFLEELATLRGKLKKGNVPNIEETARLVLRDWNTGKIPFFTLPPKDDNEIEEVTDEVLLEEGLMTMKDAFKQDFIPMKSSAPQQYREPIEEDF
jgi:nuclear GTP-binding protein